MLALAIGLGAAAAADPGASTRAAFQLGWADPDAPLEVRVEQTRMAALEYGLRSVEPAARALMASHPAEGSLAATRAAVRVAPDLPAAHMALAIALWRDQFAPVAALGAGVDAVRAFERNLEAALWWRATALCLGVLSLVGGGMLFLVLLAAGIVRHAAHDLGDIVSSHAPGFSRAAFLGGVLLVPAALGEGPLGFALALFGMGVVYANRPQRLAAAIAAALLVAGLHPLTGLAVRALGAMGADPVATAAHTAEHGLASPTDLARLEQAATTDPLAARALALGVKRTGDLVQADARYRELRASTPGDPVLLNNAANVRLALGDVRGAVRFYQEALEVSESPVILFNLSQAWGVLLKIDQLGQTLARAQELDPRLIEDLSEIQGRSVHFVADLPVPIAAIRERLLRASDGFGLAAELRRPLAPGRLGKSPLVASIAFAGVLVGACVLGGRFRPSAGCSRCGGRVCPRCDQVADTLGMCRSCSRLSRPPETTDSGLRAARLARLRTRQRRIERLSRAGALVVPGAAGLIAGRPGLGLTGALLFCGAVACIATYGGAVPDPLAAGAAGPVAFALVGGLLGLAYLGVLVAALAAGRGA